MAVGFLTNLLNAMTWTPPSYQHAAIASPFTDATLRTIVLADAAGLDWTTPGRLTAMRVPSIAKGRGLIVGLSRYPLARYDADTELTPAPWMQRSRYQAPSERQRWTYDDMIFNGLAVWALERGPGDNSPVLDAVRMAPSLWRIEPDGTLQVREHPLAPWRTASREEVCIIPGPQEGLLTLAATTIGAARDMESAWAKRVKSPIPLMALSSTDSTVDLEDAEIEELVSSWETARAAGGTAFVPYGIKAEALGQVVADLFIQGRNAVRIDVANYLQLPVALLDGSPATASLTYSTSEGKRDEFADLSLSYWSEPLEARLSQDDMTEPGTRCAHDLEHLAAPKQPTQSPAQED